MATRADNVIQTPIHPARVTLPGDATSNLVRLGPLTPDGGPAKAVRWLGAGSATLWFVPATPRAAYTTSEQAVPVPNARGAIPMSFSTQYEERIIEAQALDTDSTAGIWEVMY